VTNHSTNSAVRDFAFTQELSSIARRALEETGATGIAIALKEEEVFVCRATAGTTVPSLGVQLNANSGITGACIRSGEPALCEDASLDTRVNTEACRELQIASVLVVPIVRNGGTVGIFEALSSEPRAFDLVAQVTLEMFARKIESEHLETAAVPFLISRETTNAAPDSSCPTAVAVESISELDKIWDAALTLPSDDPDGVPERAPGNASSPKGSKAQAIVARVLLCAAVILAIAYFHLPFRVAGNTAKSQSLSSTVATLPLKPVSLSVVGAVPNFSSSTDGAATRVKTEPTKKSRASLEAAAREGDPVAQLQFATALAKGEGVRKNPVAAYAWYVVANLAGQQDSNNVLPGLSKQLSAAQIAKVRIQLADMYWNGIGVKQDRTAAYSWLALAGTSGSREAARLKRSMASEMTSSQIAEAQQRADAWLAQHQKNNR
jgi:putative methionine-R-sulfoxide reductase with GAF domain